MVPAHNPWLVTFVLTRAYTIQPCQERNRATAVMSIKENPGLQDLALVRLNTSGLIFLQLAIRFLTRHWYGTVNRKKPESIVSGWKIRLW